MANKKLSLNELKKLVKQIIKEEIQLDQNENEYLSDGDKKITTSYYVVDEESAEMGDAKERGWYDKDGESMIPDEFDDEDVTAVDKAVNFLLKNGATEPSSSSPGPNIWFSTPDPDRDYSSGEDTYYDYHLNGFTPEEVIEIFNRIKQKRRY